MRQVVDLCMLQMAVMIHFCMRVVSVETTLPSAAVSTAMCRVVCRIQNLKIIIIIIIIIIAVEVITWIVVT